MNLNSIIKYLDFCNAFFLFTVRIFIVWVIGMNLQEQNIPLNWVWKATVIVYLFYPPIRSLLKFVNKK